MNGDLWVGALATLSGAVLGGAISLALNRQQIKEARALRAHNDAQAKNQRSEDRRFSAYIEFSIQARSYREAMRSHNLQQETKTLIKNMNELAQAVNVASALIFMIVESEITYGICQAIVIVVGRVQSNLQDESFKRSRDLWVQLNGEMAELIREFQVAARDELGIDGLNRAVILDRNFPPPRLARE